MGKVCSDSNSLEHLSRLNFLAKNDHSIQRAFFSNPNKTNLKLNFLIDLHAMQKCLLRHEASLISCRRTKRTRRHMNQMISKPKKSFSYDDGQKEMIRYDLEKIRD